MSEENKYILQVKDLHTSFATDAGEVRAVNGVSFNLEPGKTLILFDEVQECPAVRSAIKFLVEDGRFDYIE